MATQGAAASRPLRGITLMVIAMLILPLMDGLAKILGDHMSVIQIVWARVVFSALATLPVVLMRGAARWWWPHNFGYQVARSILLLVSTSLFFTGLKHLPLADTLAIFFVMPLILTALSPFVLNEPVDRATWAAVAVGFVGTLTIIRPGFQEMNVGTFAALGAGCTIAVYMLITRKIAGATDAIVTTLHTSLAGTAIASLAVPFVWVTPTTDQWGLMIAIGVIAAAGHYFIIRAYDFAPAPVLAPLAYLEMIGATAVGYVLFRQLPDRWTVLGVLILIGSAIFISLHERRKQRKGASRRA